MKYKVKHYILRAAPLILVCCMFLFVFSPSASADSVSYLDLDPNIVVDGDNNLITVSIPTEYMKIQIRNTNNDVLAFGNDFLIYPVSSSSSYRIDVSFFSDVHLDITGIPDGSVFSWTVEQVQGISLFSPLSFAGEYWTYDLNDDPVFWHGLDPSTDIPLQGEYSISFNIDKTNASSLSFGGYYSHSRPNSDGNFGLYIVDATMQFTISSFLASQQGNAQTNKLLDEVNRQLEEQGNDLDQIINGSVDPEIPEGADKVEDLDQAEAQLRDDAQTGLDEGVQIQQNVLQILEQYANGFAVFSWLFGLFVKQPFISGLLYVSVSLGTVGAILNLGLTAVKSAGSRAGKTGMTGKASKGG